MYERTVRSEIERRLENVRNGLEEPRPQESQADIIFWERLKERYKTLSQVLDLIDAYVFEEDDTDCFLPDDDGGP